MTSLVREAVVNSLEQCAQFNSDPARLAAAFELLGDRAARIGHKAQMGIQMAGVLHIRACSIYMVSAQVHI